MKKLEVERIAQLSRLRFEEEDLEQFVPGFEQILDYFEQLKAVETEDVEATFHAVAGEGTETPYREDRVEGSLTSQEALENAPRSREDHFRVPRVIE